MHKRNVWYNLDMEKQIREYEKFIERETRAGKERGKRLFELHSEMVKNFQHERLIHLLVMLFFVGITILLLGVTIGLELFMVLPTSMLIMLGILDLMMTGISIAYVRHYYFLENHVQGLYKYFEKIREL